MIGNTDIGGKQFKFSFHHNISHARFMQRGLNYIMMSVEDKTIIARATWEALQKAWGRVESFPYKAEFYKKLDICSLSPEDER